MKKLLYLVLLILSIVLVNAITTNITQFDDGSSAFNITLNTTKNITIPINSTILEANISIKGYSGNDIYNTSWCYQEFSNVSTACGGVNTGLYAKTAGAPVEAYFFINYTKPSQATNNSLWQVKHALFSTYNISIPGACWNQSTLQFRIQSYISNTYSTQPMCFNGNSWTNIGNTTGGAGGASYSATNSYSNLYDGDWSTSSAWQSFENWYICTSGDCVYNDIYEEAMVWNMYSQSFPQNIKILTNNSQVFNYGGILTSSNNSIQLNKTLIQNFLITSPTIQINFTALGFGLLEVTNLIINYHPVINITQTSITPTLAYTNDTLYGYCNITSADSNVNANWQWFKNNVSISNNTHTTLCYQETANVSTSCGGLATGTYENDGSVTNFSNTIDGNWNTFGTGGNVYINYTKPSGALNTSIWQIAGSSMTNQSFDSGSALECFNAFSDKLVFNVVKSGSTTLQFKCSNGSTWLSLWTFLLTPPNFYEEAMWWNISSNYSYYTTSVVSYTNNLLSNISIENTTKNDEFIFSCQGQDTYHTTSYLNSSVLIINNSLPTITSLTLYPTIIYANNTISTNTTYTDLDGENSTLTFRWYRNGSLIYTQTQNNIVNGTLANSSLYYANFSHFEYINVSGVANDGQDNSSLLFSNTYQILNTIPVVTTPIIIPTTAFWNNSLIANTTYTDLNVDVGNVSFLWYKNGTLIYTDTQTNKANNTLVNSTLYYTNFSHLETINVSVVGYDGYDNSTKLSSSSITINNTVPQITTPVLNLTVAYWNTSITANTTYTDVDNDNGNITFKWYKNNSLIYTENKVSQTNGTIVTSSLYYGNFSHNEKINVSVTGNDGYANSTTIFSSTLIINNTVPIITTPQLSHTLIYANTSVIANTTYTDADNDIGNVSFLWYKNGTLIYTGLNQSISTNTLILSTLYYTNYSHFDNLTVDVVGYDGVANSTKLSSTTLYVNNSISSPQSIFVTNISDGVNCSYTYYDFDNDTRASQSFLWYVSNNSVNYTTQTLGLGNYTASDQLICSVLVNDGFANSSFFNSSTYTVNDNTAPVISAFSLDVDNGYTDEVHTISTTCTDTYSIANNYPMVQFRDPAGSLLGNFTMSLRTNTTNIYDKTYAFSTIGVYLNFTIFCKDGNNNEQTNQTSLSFLSSTRPVQSGTGGGGGGVIIIDSSSNTTYVKIVSKTQSSVIDLIIAPNTKREIDYEIHNTDTNDYTYRIRCIGIECARLTFNPTGTSLKKSVQTQKLTIDTNGLVQGTKLGITLELDVGKGKDSQLDVYTDVNRLGYFREYILKFIGSTNLGGIFIPNIIIYGLFGFLVSLAPLTLLKGNKQQSIFTFLTFIIGAGIISFLI